MVQMCMSQKDGIYTAGRHGKRFPVPCLELPFLIESTIHENPGAVGFQEMSRPGNVLGRTKKL
jgi:hypothetical protein